jgi:hypothetical protein
LTKQRGKAKNARIMVRNESESLIRKMLLALLDEIPFLRKIPAILKGKGSLVLKLVIIFALVLAFFIWWHYEHHPQQININKNTANTSGNNAPIFQNSPNSTFNYYGVPQQKNNPKVKASAVPQIPRQFNEPPVHPTEEPPYFNKQQLKGEVVTESNEGLIKDTVNEPNK